MRNTVPVISALVDRAFSVTRSPQASAKRAGAFVSALSVAATLGTLALTTVPASAGPITPTPISACTTLGSPGSYVLTANLGPVPGACLVISAPHVTLDLSGHSVTGMKLGTTAGIELLPKAVYGTVESTRPGGAVIAFHAGIQDYADHALIKGPRLLLTGNVGAGVYLYRVVGSVVRDAQLSGNGYFGANVQLSRHVIVHGNSIVMNNKYGIWDLSSGSSQLTANSLANNGIAGIYLGCSDTANL